MNTIFVLFLAIRAAEAVGPSAPVAAAIFRGREAGERASFLVVLREKADLSGAAAIEDRGARRRFVYEALRATADASQAPIAERLEREGVPFRRHTLVNMLEVEADESTARSLARDPAVAMIAANRPSVLAREETAFAPRSRAAIEWNVSLVGAPELWARGLTGEGVVIGIADTGVRWDHPALRDQYRGWNGSSASHAYNWHDAIHVTNTLNACGTDSPAPCDDQGHGTSVAGLAVGDDGGENQIGVAPGARWIGCRNMDNGTGSPATYVECFEFFLAPTDANGQNPRPELGADVVNNSWTCPPEEGCTDPEVLRSAVESLRAAGIAESFAAGNSGPSCSSLNNVPPIYDAAFAVGATDMGDNIAVFSARGPVILDGSNRIKPDIVAPGVGVRSSGISNPLDPYTTFGGTSGASPHVAGAIALLWSAVPWLAGQVTETEELLEASAVRLTSGVVCGGISGSHIPNPIFGWGRLDIAAAHALATARVEPELPASVRPAPRVLPPR
jgi:serine protease AprX